MKEAAGEANLTVIAIVLIAIVAAVATPLISNMMRGTADKSCCQQYGGQWKSGGKPVWQQDYERDYEGHFRDE